MKKLNKKLKVRNMVSERGNKIANQFEIYLDNAVFFQSYNTIIALNDRGQIYLDENAWDCSMTTGKYRNIFLREKRPETERKIANGTYKLVNLN